MENDFLVNCSTPFLVASRSDATPCQNFIPREPVPRILVFELAAVVVRLGYDAADAL